MKALFILSFIILNFKLFGIVDPFLLQEGDYRNIEINNIDLDESLFKLSKPSIIVLDYELLKMDFPELKDKEQHEIDSIVLSNIGFIAKTQVEWGEKKNTNDAIPHENRVQKIGAVRQVGFGRALDIPFFKGYINVKGIGAKNPERKEHGDGLMTLGETLREFIYTQIVNMVFNHSQVNYGVTRTYGVIYPRFNVTWKDGNKDPAGYLLRRAYNRQDPNYKKSNDLEELLNDYNVILDGNVQTTEDGRLIDLGHAIMGDFPNGMNILQSNIQNFSELYGHDSKITTKERWGLSKLDSMWNEMHDIAKKYAGKEDIRFQFEATISKYLTPISTLLFPNGKRNNFLRTKLTRKLSMANLLDPSVPVGHTVNIIKSRDLKRLNDHIHWFAKHGDINQIKILLQNAGTDINKKDTYGNTPLHLAVNGGHKDLVEYLLKVEKIDLNLKNSMNKTVLHRAVLAGHKDIVELFLNDKRINIYAKDNYNENLMHMAAELGHKEILERLLLDKNLDINEKNMFGESPFLLAAKHGKKEIIELLLTNNDVDINCTNKDLKQALHLASEWDRKEVAELLLQDKRVDINAKDIDAKTALHLATANRAIQVVELLLKDKRILVNEKTKYIKGTPFYEAVLNSHKEMVEILLKDHRIDINAKDAFKTTPLHWAIIKGQYEIVDLLLKDKRIKINSVDKDGNTPLHNAVNLGNTEIVKMILKDKRVKVNITNNLGETPLLIAEGILHIDIINLIKRYKLQHNIR